MTHKQERKSVPLLFKDPTSQDTKYQLYVEIKKKKKSLVGIATLQGLKFLDSKTAPIHAETSVKTSILVYIHFIEFIDFQTNLYKLQNSFW